WDMGDVGSTFMVAWSPAKDLLAVASPRADEVRILPVHGAGQVRTLPVHNAHSVSWAPHQMLLAIGSGSGHVSIWEIEESPKRIEEFRHPQAGPISIAWSPRGERLAVASTVNSDVIVRNLRDQSERTISIQTGYIGQLAWNPSGTQLAIPIHGGKVIVVD